MHDPGFQASLTPRYADQPSPDKNVNCPCTSSSFTCCLAGNGFVMHGPLASATRPSMTFLFVACSSWLRLPSHGSSLPAVAFASYFVDWSYPLGMSVSLRLPVSYRGLSPHNNHAHAGRTQTVAHGAAGRAASELNVVRRGPVNGGVLSADHER